MTGSPNLTTRAEGEIFRGQPAFAFDSPKLLREGEGGEGRMVVKEEGGEICDRRGGVDVKMATGDEAAEPNRQNSRSAIGRPDAHILHQFPG